MDNQIFYLDLQRKEPIEVSSGYNWGSFSIKKDGESLTPPMSKSMLYKGIEVELKDGRKLAAYLTDRDTLVLTIDDRPVIGSVHDPLVKLKKLCYFLFILAAINFFCGIISEYTTFGFFKWLGIMGMPNILMGIAYSLVGFWVWYKRAAASLYIALALAAFDFLIWSYTVLMIRLSFNTAEILLRFIILYTIWEGIQLLKELNTPVDENSIDEIGKS